MNQQAIGDRQMVEALDERLKVVTAERDRLRGIVCTGVQHGADEAQHFILLNDDAGETKTSFALQPGQTVGEAVELLDLRWAEGEAKVQEWQERERTHG